MQRNITVGAVQFEHAEGDKQANLSKVRHWVELAARRNVEIVVFPVKVQGEGAREELNASDISAESGSSVRIRTDAERQRVCLYLRSSRAAIGGCDANPTSVPETIPPPAMGCTLTPMRALVTRLRRSVAMAGGRFEMKSTSGRGSRSRNCRA